MEVGQLSLHGETGHSELRGGTYGGCDGQGQSPLEPGEPIHHSHSSCSFHQADITPASMQSIILYQVFQRSAVMLLSMLLTGGCGVRPVARLCAHDGGLADELISVVAGVSEGGAHPQRWQLLSRGGVLLTLFGLRTRLLPWLLPRLRARAGGGCCGGRAGLACHLRVRLGSA